MISGRAPSALNRNRIWLSCASTFLFAGLLSGCGIFGDNVDEDNSGQPAERAKLEAVDDKELIQPVINSVLALIVLPLTGTQAFCG